MIEFNETVHDVVMRYFKIRPERVRTLRRDGITFRGGSRIVLDHLSVQWATDELISINPNEPYTVTDITIQNSLLGACLRPHSTGLLMASSDAVDDIRRISVHHNLFVHNAHRNPAITASNQIEVINNVIYNVRNRIGEMAGGVTADFIGNYFQAGPWNPNPFLYRRRELGNDPTFFVSGNRAFPLESNYPPDESYPADIQRGMWQIEPGNAFLPDSYFSDVRQADGAPYPIRIDRRRTTLNKVLESVGDSIRLNSEGIKVGRRDALDASMIRDVRNGTGPATDQEMDDPSDFGGFPVVDPGAPYADMDGDGMPDVWEIVRGLDPNDPADAVIVGRDGYTNIEHFLN